MSQKKLAVLGGGVGSLSAVYYLTSQPDWADKYDITVYQMGWRLGGKGASGRNAESGQRIQEHGFHILFGFYENCFATMRECYKELGRSSDQPLSEFVAENPNDEDKYPERYAMKRHHSWIMKQHFNGNWYDISLNFPMNGNVPGDGTFMPTFWDYIAMGIGWAITFAEQSTFTQAIDKTILKEVLDKIEDLTEDVLLKTNAVLDEVDDQLMQIGLIRKIADVFRDVTEDVIADLNPLYKIIVELLELHLKRFWNRVEGKIDTDWEAYRDWILQDFVCTTIIGFVRDDILNNGFDSINHLNFYEWFLSHASVLEGSHHTVGSVLIQGAYDSSFAYVDGDSTSPATEQKPLTGNPDLEAGTMLRGGMRMMMGYKGSLSWMFQAGCGDVIVAPMYEVLKRRGVKFKFFHKVHKLTLPVNGEKVIETIEMERQVDLAPHVIEYDPLVEVKGLPCLPSEPQWEQIADGEAKTNRVNLESSWADYTPTDNYIMQHGVDFDEILLGISVAALHTICADLRDDSVAWKNMLDHVKTVRTQGYQLWFSKTYEELGWKLDKPTVDVAVEPINSYGDMSQEIAREDWTGAGDDTPKSIAYFCGAMADDPNQPPTPDPSYPPTQTKLVKETCNHYLQNESRYTWTNATTDNGFCYEWLVDAKERTGEDRLNAQYFRANIDPSERYVLSVTNSTKHRLEAGGSGYANLYLAGDWVKNGINAGCMEATVMSGMMASRAMTGFPRKIPGEHDFE